MTTKLGIKQLNRAHIRYFKIIYKLSNCKVMQDLYGPIFVPPVLHIYIVNKLQFFCVYLSRNMQAIFSIMHTSVSK